VGISEYIAREHCAKWSPARQPAVAGISSMMSLVHAGEAGAQAFAHQGKSAVIQ
jgi:hypothetical protein